MRSTEVLSLKGRRTADCEIAQDFRPTFHHGKCRGEAGRTNNTRLQEVFYGKRPSLVQKHARKRKRLHHTSTAPVAPQNYQLTSCSQPTLHKGVVWISRYNKNPKEFSVLLPRALTVFVPMVPSDPWIGCRQRPKPECNRLIA